MRIRSLGRPTWMSIATILLFLGAAAIGTNILLATIHRNHDGPIELESVLGSRIDSLLKESPELASWARLRSERGTSWALYVFRTDCPACTSQKAQMAASFRALPKARFVTSSPEEHETIDDYWHSALPSPIHVSQAALRELGVPGVPALLIISPANIVQEAWLGVVTSWPPKSIQSRLE